jgi:hypothetical protein
LNRREDRIMTSHPAVPGDMSNDVTEDGVFRAVRDGYDAVYRALPHGHGDAVSAPRPDRRKTTSVGSRV